jgi:peptidoglycan lytic transglycosylase B
MMSDHPLPQHSGAGNACACDACDITRRRLLQGMAASLALLGMPGLLAAATTEIAKGIHPSISADELATKLAVEFRLSPASVRETLARAQFVPSVIERILTPYEAKPYAEYRPLFVNKQLAGLGKDYLREHKALFAKNEKTYGIEPEIIAAILGMETRYGSNIGKDSVLNSLYTLSVGYPQRADFFRRELGNFLLLCREEKLSPEKILGSYAGAFGETQFMPSSYRHFAVDADGDGRRDVWNSPADIIASVANYFHKNRWQPGKPVAHWLPQATKKHVPSLEAQAKLGLRDWKTVADFSAYLPHLPKAWHKDDKATIIEMQPSHGRELALVHYNFYVITRWNRSYNYAMAVTELAWFLGCKLCRTNG